MTEGKERELTDKIRRAPRGWAWYISRAKAIAEGRLMDVTEQAREAGIGCPVAVTPVAQYEGVDCGVGENEAARLRHLLDSLRSPSPCWTTDGSTSNSRWRSRTKSGREQRRYSTSKPSAGQATTANRLSP